MTFNKITDHLNPISASLEFLKIEEIRQLQLLSFVYAWLNKAAPVYYNLVAMETLLPWQQEHLSITLHSEVRLSTYLVHLFIRAIRTHK